MKSDLVLAKQENEKSIKAGDVLLQDAKHETECVKNELCSAKRTIQRLSNTESLASAAILERLDKLDALEAGGVDNWQWYDESIEDYKQSIEASLEK